MAGICYIVNPATGDGLGKNIRDIIVGRGEEDVYLTDERGHATEIAAAASRDGFRTIVVVGGDGTIYEVINGVAKLGFKTSLGIIPVGTGNDLAAELGLTRLRNLKDLNKLDRYLKVAKEGAVAWIDLIRIEASETVLFGANQFSFGFSGEVAAFVDRLEQRSQWMYIRYALLNVWRAKTFPLKGYYEGEILDVYITNGKRIAGSIKIAPGAGITDGKLEVLIIPKVSILERYVYIALARFGYVRGAEGIIANELEETAEVRLSNSTLAQIDGEPITLQPGTVRVSVEPRALGVAVPAKVRPRLV